MADTLKAQMNYLALRRELAADLKRVANSLERIVGAIERAEKALSQADDTRREP